MVEYYEKYLDPFLVDFFEALLHHGSSLEFFQFLLDRSHMTPDLDLRPDMHNVPFWINEERTPLDPVELFPEHLLRGPGFESFNDRMVRIAEECDVQIIFISKFLMTFNRIRAHTHDHGIH